MRTSGERETGEPQDEGGRWTAMTRDIRWWYLIAVLIIVAGIVMTLWTAQQEDQQLRAELLAKARIATGSVDPALVAGLTGSSADLGSADYQELKGQMARIHAADPSSRFAYLMGQGPDGVFFYVDSEPAGSPDYSPPGQLYPEVSPQIAEAFSSGVAATEGPASDRWGTWVSAYVPVRDPATGQVVGVFGMDVDAISWLYAVAQGSVAVITATLLIVLLLITFGFSQQHLREDRERLAASEEKFSRAFHANPALMAVTTIEEGQFVDVNGAFLQALGYTREEVIGQRCTALGLYEDPGMRDTVIRRLSEGGLVRDVDMQVIRKDGSRLNGLFSAMTIEVAGKACLLTVMLDITERKRVEDAFRKATRTLGVLTRLTRKDLLNEVFILNGYLDLATRDVAGQERVLEKIHKAERAARSINEIAQFIQDYQDLGAMPPIWQNVATGAMFGLSHISKAETRFELATEDLEVYADPLLERAWQGLFENAVLHGGHVTSVRVYYTATADEATIFVEDDGTGIPQDRKEQVFSHADRGGTGVRGLFFIREILDITGITIRETGEPGKGARFELCVPKGGFRIQGEDMDRTGRKGNTP